MTNLTTRTGNSGKIRDPNNKLPNILQKRVRTQANNALNNYNKGFKVIRKVEVPIVTVSCTLEIADVDRTAVGPPKDNYTYKHGGAMF